MGSPQCWQFISVLGAKALANLCGINTGLEQLTADDLHGPCDIFGSGFEVEHFTEANNIHVVVSVLVNPDPGHKPAHEFVSPWSFVCVHLMPESLVAMRPLAAVMTSAVHLRQRRPRRGFLVSTLKMTSAR